MSRRAATPGVVLTALLAGCAPPEFDDQGAAASAWVEVGAAQFAGDGETPSLAIAALAPGAALALRVTTDPGVCFQLSSVVDGEGHAAVAGRSAGAYCRDCALRSSVAVEAGVFMLPFAAAGLAPETGLSLRFARVDCLTLTPSAAPRERPTLRVEAQAVDAAPALASIDLRFHVAESSILFGDEDRQQALLAHLEQALAPGGLSPRLVAVHELAEMPAELGFHAGDHAALAAVLAQVPPRAETTVDVVFGGCLLYDDPIFGPPAAVHGFTPRIPGGAGPADGVFMPGLDCFAQAAGPDEVPVHLQARVLAHELGHYLGLYHVIEADGLADQLEDTGPDNIMHPNPQLAAAVGFSPAQGRLMRMHPAVRAR